MRSKLFSASLVLVAMMLAGAQTARADIISLVSQSYRINASGTTMPIGAPPDPVSYDQTASTPLSRTDSRISFCEPGHVGCGSFLLETRATGDVSPTTAFVLASSHTDDSALAIANFAAATASITFIPLETQLLLSTDWAFGVNGLITLYDETAAELILSTKAIAQFVLPFQLNHTYTMTASTNVCCLAREEAKATLTAVPEPGTSALFLILGFAGLGMCMQWGQTRDCNNR